MIAIILSLLLVGGIIFMLVYTYLISKRVYFSQLVRTDKEKWGRSYSAPLDRQMKKRRRTMTPKMS